MNGFEIRKPLSTASLARTTDHCGLSVVRQCKARVETSRAMKRAAVHLPTLLQEPNDAMAMVMYVLLTLGSSMAPICPMMLAAVLRA